MSYAPINFISIIWNHKWILSFGNNNLNGIQCYPVMVWWWYYEPAQKKMKWKFFFSLSCNQCGLVFCFFLYIWQRHLKAAEYIPSSILHPLGHNVLLHPIQALKFYYTTVECDFSIMVMLRTTAIHHKMGNSFFLLLFFHLVVPIFSNGIENVFIPIKCSIFWYSFSRFICKCLRHLTHIVTEFKELNGSFFSLGYTVPLKLNVCIKQ